MRKMLTMSNNCQECVFHHKKCILGHQRPWNAATCDDYQPYCLVCNYPEEFCNTCRNLASRWMKPLDEELQPAYGRLSPDRYACVWQPPSTTH